MLIVGCKCYFSGIWTAHGQISFKNTEKAKSLRRPDGPWSVSTFILGNKTEDMSGKTLWRLSLQVDRLLPQIHVHVFPCDGTRSLENLSIQTTESNLKEKHKEKETGREQWPLLQNHLYFWVLTQIISSVVAETTFINHILNPWGCL